MIAAWLQRRREGALRARFESGFDYAAGLLLRGVQPDAIRRLRGPEFSPDVFEKGMDAAVSAHLAKELRRQRALAELRSAAEEDLKAAAEGEGE